MLVRKAAISFISLLILVVNSPSYAAKVNRKSKTVGDLLRRIEKNTKKVKFSKSKSALPTYKSMQPRKASKVNLNKVKPPSRSRLYYEEGTDEGELEQVTDDGIKQLYKLSRQFKTSKRRGEIWLRLAELYVEKSRLIEYRLQQNYDEKVKEFNSGKTKTRPKLILKPALDYNRKAVQLYEWFLRDFPNDPKVDQALFFLGYNYFELNLPDKGKNYYKRLTEKHPNSPYIEESNFALGEYHFERQNWQDAEKYYQYVAKKPKARLYSFSQYKLAWCQYKTGQVKVGLKSLEKVIRVGRSAIGKKQSHGGVSQIRLATEAQKDLVLFYAEAGQPEEARSYFTSVAGEKATFGLLERLAYYYADTGNRSGARLLFRELIEERPTSPKAYDYQYQIVSMYTSTDKPEVFKAELFAWINNYRIGSRWARANQKDKELVAKSQQLIETTLRTHILHQHQTAQNSRVKTAQAAAKDSYDLYFRTFESDEKLDEMHFFFAELLFDMGDFQEASSHYNWVVENAPNSKYFEMANLNSVLAAEKGLPSEGDLKKQVGDSLDPVSFMASVAQFEKAATRYMEKFPQGENVPAMKYKLGALYYYHNQFDRALDTFNSIIKNYPKSQYAQYSANLTLDIYNLRKDYVGLEKAGQDILTNEALANSQVGDQVKGVLQRASFKQAQDLEAKKDFAGAAQSYEGFATKNAGAELGTAAAFNSAVNYERAGNLAKAIGMYGIVLKSKDKASAPQREKAQQFLGTLYEKTGQYERAASAFESYANSHEKDKSVVSLYYNAAIIRDGMNQYGSAAANYQKFFDKSRAAERWDALLLMAAMHERRGQITKAQGLYKEYYDARPKNPAGLIEAAYKVATIHKLKGRRSDAEDWYKKVIYWQKRSSTNDAPVGVSYAAEAKFFLIQPTFEEFRKIKIPSNPAAQGKAVQNKLAMLERLKNQLKDVIAYDDGTWIVNSLALIGQAYQHMAAAIYAVPLPKGLDADGLNQYKAGVEKIAQPFQTEAINNYEAAIKKANELEGYGDGLLTAQKELHRLDPKRVPAFETRVAPAKFYDEMDILDDAKIGNAYKSNDEGILLEVTIEMLSADEHDLKALAALAGHYYRSKKYGLSRILLMRALVKNPDMPELHNNIAVISESDGKLRPAIGGYRKALELKSRYWLAGANLGAVSLTYRDYAKAADVLGPAYSAVRSHLKTDLGANIASNNALALAGIGEDKKAVKILESIVEDNPNHVPARLNLASILIHKIGDKREGEKQLNKLRFLIENDEMRSQVDQLEKVLREN